LAFFRVNNIHNASQLYDYFHSWSNKADQCYGDGSKWNCDQPKIDDGTTPTDSSRKDPGSVTDPTNNQVQPISELEKKLSAIQIAPKQKVDYNRADWKHWSDLDGNKCDTREDVLIQQGKDVKTSPTDNCRPISGKWISVYDGKEFTNPSSLDIDHVIPLGYAATHGGQNWDAAKKEAFANDRSHLLAVSATENRKKSDKGPGDYMPPKVSYYCSYGQIWVNTISKYGLTIDQKDADALKKALGTC